MTTTAPWAATTKPEVVAAVYTTIVETLRVCGILLQPFMPTKAGTLLDALGVPVEQRTLEHAALGQGTVGHVQSGIRLFEVRKSEEQGPQ